MIVALIAIALSAAPPAEEPPMTVGQLYEGCARYVARAGRPPNQDDAEATACEVTVVTVQVVEAANAATGDLDPSQPDVRKFCQPESITGDGDAIGRTMARAFTAFVDRHPASRSEDATAVFDRALAEKWPCPA